MTVYTQQVFLVCVSLWTKHTKKIGRVRISILESVNREIKGHIWVPLLFFFFLNMTFPLALIKVSLNPQFRKLLIEREFAYWAYFFQRIAIINGSSNFTVKFNFVLPLQKSLIDLLLRNEPCHNNDFYLIIKWHEVGSTTFYKYIAYWQINPISKGEGL